MAMFGLAIGVLMGVLGTIAMDLWAIFLARAFGQPQPNWAMPGRWLGHFAHGKFAHADIAQAPAITGERFLGWALHYGVGIIYGVTFVWFAGWGWLASPTFFPLWIFSIATIAAGWFLLQPCLGLGWAGSKTPNPAKTRVMGLLAHTVFALGMWIGASLL